MDVKLSTPIIGKRIKKRSRTADFLIRLFKEQPLGALGAVITLILALTGIFANFLAPYDPGHMDLLIRMAPPSAQHLLGTDQIGRDIFSRIIYGCRIDMLIGLAATSIAAFFATVIGVLSGYIGGTFDVILQRFIDALMSFPGLLLLMTIMTLIGSGLIQITIVLGILFSIGSSRIIRGSVMSIKENVYIKASQAIGSSTLNTLVRHILPNIMPTIIIIFSANIGGIILAESSLSFLGFGITVGTPSWGGMLSWEGRKFMEINPNLAIWPGVALSIAVFGLNMFGDAVRDLLDPRLRGGVGRYVSANISKIKAKINREKENTVV